MRPEIFPIMDPETNYIEKYGKLIFISTTWDIFVPYNLSQYLNEIIILNENYDSFKQAYANISYKFGPPLEDNIKKQLNTYKNEIEVDLAGIKLKHDQILTHLPHYRQKRVVPTIVKIVKSIYNVLSYNEQTLAFIEMEKFNNNKNQFLDIDKAHVTVFRDMLSSLNQSISKNEIVINEFTSDLSTLINQFRLILQADPRKQPRHDYFETAFFGLLKALKQNTENFVKQVSYEQDNLIQYLTFASSGKLHPTVLAQSVLLKKIQSIASFLSNDLIYPGELLLQSTTVKFLDFMSVSMEFEEEVLIFKITVPFVNKNFYQLHKIWTIPFIKNTDILSVTQKLKIIGLSAGRAEHILTNEGQLSECKFLNNLYICDDNMEKMTQSCELQLLQEKGYEYCQVRQFKEGFFLRQLMEIGQHLFFTKTEDTLRVTCEHNESYNLVLKNKGMLQISKYCHLERDGKIILNSKLKELEINDLVYVNKWAFAVIITSVVLLIVGLGSGIVYFITEIYVKNRPQIPLNLSEYSMQSHSSINIRADNIN